jgi:hypothetical protein
MQVVILLNQSERNSYVIKYFWKLYKGILQKSDEMCRKYGEKVILFTPLSKTMHQIY